MFAGIHEMPQLSGRLPLLSGRLALLSGRLPLLSGRLPQLSGRLSVPITAQSTKPSRYQPNGNVGCVKCVVTTNKLVTISKKITF